MEPHIQSVILTFILSVISGVIGYTLREFKNRNKPLCSITTVNNDLRESYKLIDLSVEIVKPLREPNIIGALARIDTLSNISDIWNSSDQIIINAKSFKELLEEGTKATKNDDQDSMQNILLKILSDSNYADWLFWMIVYDIVKFNDIPEGIQKKISTYNSPADEGAIIFNFPGSPIRFGTQFDKEALFKKKCEPFIDLVSHLYMPGLENALDQINQNFERQVSIAKDIKPLTKKILDDNTNWSFNLHVANLGKTPFLIHLEANLNVKDETGANYKEKCQLAIISKDDDGSDIMLKSPSPLVVGSEKDIYFAFITKKCQKDMVRGDAFREAFDSGAAICWLELTINKIGFKRQKPFLTPEVQFISDN